MVDLQRAHNALTGIQQTLAGAGGGGNYAAVRASYLISLSEAAQAFLDGGSQRTNVNAAQRAMIEAYGSAAESGLGGAQPEGDDLKLLNREVEAERNFIESLFGDLKMQRQDGNTQLPASRIELFGNSLDALFSAFKTSAAQNTMLTMDGDDGNESCKDCQRLKGQRHRARWWAEKGLIPGQPGNDNYECKGFNCAHVLIDDQGNPFTV